MLESLNGLLLKSQLSNLNPFWITFSNIDLNVDIMSSSTSDSIASFPPNSIISHIADTTFFTYFCLNPDALSTDLSKSLQIPKLA